MVEIDLRNGDDAADLVSPTNTITRIWLGTGADTLTADTAEGVVAEGQAGNDSLTGGNPLQPDDFTDSLGGGPGDDIVFGPGRFARTAYRVREGVAPVAGLSLAASLDGRIVGIVHYLYHRSTWTMGNYCYLQDLFTAEEARGQGAGRALIEAALRENEEA